jgi:hypothetical protein
MDSCGRGGVWVTAPGNDAMRQDMNMSGDVAGVRRFVQESARTRSPVGGRASVTDDAGNGVAWRSPRGQAGGETQAHCTPAPLLRRSCSLAERNRSAMGYAATSCQGTHLRGMVVFVNERVHALSNVLLKVVHLCCSPTKAVRPYPFALLASSFVPHHRFPCATLSLHRTCVPFKRGRWGFWPLSGKAR